LDFSFFISSFVNIQVAQSTYDMAAATLTLSAQHACVHAGCTYTTRHLGHLRRHLQTRHGVGHGQAIDARLIADLVAQLADFQSKLAALVVCDASAPHGNTDDDACDHQPHIECEHSEDSTSPRVKSPARVRTRACLPVCMTAAHRPYATALSFRCVQLSSIWRALQDVTDVNGLNRVVIACARAALDDEQGAATNPVFRRSSEEYNWEVWTVNKAWHVVDDAGLCQHLHIGLLWALREILRNAASAKDDETDYALVTALLNSEYELARQTAACPSVHKLRMEWLVPRLAGEQGM
jgi:hypothetical protein